MSILDPIEPIKDAVDNTVKSAVRSAESVLPPLPGMKGGFPVPPIPMPNFGAKGLGPFRREGPDEHPPIERDGIQTRPTSVNSIRYEKAY